MSAQNQTPIDYSQITQPPRCWLFGLLAAVFGIALAFIAWTEWERLQFWSSGTVAWEQVPFAMHQRALWSRNQMCALAPGEQTDLPPATATANMDRPRLEPQQIAAFTGMKIRLQACWNGDVLVRTVQDDRLGRAIWIAAEGFPLEEAAGLSRPAYARGDGASSPAAHGSTFDVICQNWADGSIESGRVIRIISVKSPDPDRRDGPLQEDARIRETINIFTGEVLSADTVRPDGRCEAK